MIASELERELENELEYGRAGINRQIVPVHIHWKLPHSFFWPELIDVQGMTEQDFETECKAIREESQELLDAIDELCCTKPSSRRCAGAHTCSEFASLEGHEAWRFYPLPSASTSIEASTPCKCRALRRRRAWAHRSREEGVEASKQAETLRLQTSADRSGQPGAPAASQVELGHGRLVLGHESPSPLPGVCAAQRLSPCHRRPVLPMSGEVGIGDFLKRNRHQVIPHSEQERTVRPRHPLIFALRRLRHAALLPVTRASYMDLPVRWTPPS